MGPLLQRHRTRGTPALRHRRRQRRYARYPLSPVFTRPEVGRKGQAGEARALSGLFSPESPERRRPGVLSGAIFPGFLCNATCAVPVRRRFFRSI